MITRRAHSGSFIGLGLSWLVYALCQGDFLLPAAALGVVGLSWARLLGGHGGQRSWTDMSWRSLIGLSVVGGGIWRSTVMPPPGDAVSFIPVFLPALQSGAVLLSVIAWFRFADRWRRLFLRAIPWVIVALALNVPFHPLSHLAFWLFCFVAVGLMIADLYVPADARLARTIQTSPSKSRWVYAYPLLLAVIAGGMFTVLVKGIKLGDDIFMDLIQNYVVMRRPSFFGRDLNLARGGVALLDRRPFIELERKGRPCWYLAGQVFEDYADGVWTAPEDLPRHPLPLVTEPEASAIEMRMLESFEGIIPAPREVTAMSSKGRVFEQDRNALISTTEERLPVIRFTLAGEGLEADPDRIDLPRLLRVPPGLRGSLRARTAAWIGADRDPWATARGLERFFHEQFTYDLNVGFYPDNQGLLNMLDYRRPAYCIHFASAMALMLRANGIPARVVGGFLASDISGFAPDQFLVRGRDAHAWVEALLPVTDPRTGAWLRTAQGRPRARWVRMDPTPADARRAVIDAHSRMNAAADWIWYTQKRLRAALLEIETRTLVRLLFVVTGLVVLEEVVKTIWRRRRVRVRRAGSVSPGAPPCLELYRRFEEDLFGRWSIERRPAETDAEWLTRLSFQPGLPPDIVGDMRVFLRRYAAVRFGGGEDTALTWPPQKP